MAATKNAKPKPPPCKTCGGSGLKEVTCTRCQGKPGVVCSGCGSTGKRREHCPDCPKQ